MKTIISYALLLIWCESPALADFVFSPNVANPNGSIDGPFLLTQSEAASIRYQQVYAASSFLSVSSLPVSITELSFAQIPGGLPLDFNLPSIEIRLSTTQNAPDGLSPFFAQNVGADDSVVLSGSLHFYQSTVERYGVHVLLQQPFIYHPQTGNLLMDVRNFQTIPDPGMPIGVYAQIALGDSVSLVAIGNVNDPGGSTGTAGLLTRFTVTPIPEPGTALLILAGLAAGALLRGKFPQTNSGRPPVPR